MEKKDLLIYIDKRIEHLERQKEKVLPNIPMKKRDTTWERFNGRILELRYLKKHVNDVKSQAKRFWREEAWRTVKNQEEV